MFKNLLKNYIATVCNITTQTSPNSVDSILYYFANPRTKTGPLYRGSKFKIENTYAMK